MVQNVDFVKLPFISLDLSFSIPLKTISDNKSVLFAHLNSCLLLCVMSYRYYCLDVYWGVKLGLLLSIITCPQGRLLTQWGSTPSS